jgi:iron(III) transport system ATP-binding protein
MVPGDRHPRDLCDAPGDVFVAGFMGEANRVKGLLRRVDDVTGVVEIGGLRVELPHRRLAEGAVDVAIRPEALLIDVASEGTAGIRGTVTQVAYLGSRMEYSIGTEIGDLFVTSPVAYRPLTAGVAVTLTLANHGVTLIRP